jgi:DNA-binding IclR family transcriptional regulator
MAERSSGDGTVAKALAVMDDIAAAGRPLRFAELLDRSPYPKATLYRFVQVLTKQGMLQFDPERQTYAPGLRLVRLAHAAWQASSLAPVARPHLDALSDAVGETVHLAQLDGAQVLYVDKRNARQPVEMYSAAGKIGPAYCTGVGKAMLAFLAEPDLTAVLAQQSFHRFTPATLVTPEALRADLTEIRARGHAFDREEHEPGIVCIAHPILTRGDRVLGAISITSTTARTTLAGLGTHAPRLSAAAHAIANDAQDWRFPEPPNAARTKGREQEPCRDYSSRP